jgi:hypothetical protein
VMTRAVWMRIGVSVIALLAGACQSPTDPDDVIDYDEVLDAAASPEPILADTNTGGRTYRVVRGNNQPDDILPYDWHAVFAMTLTFNANANDNDVDIDFPVKITATTVTVKQASGGIITPPSGTETEKSEFVIVGTSSNQLTGIGSPTTTTFEIWYDLPSLRKEAVVVVTFSFTDNDGTVFQKERQMTVAP